MKLNSRAQSAQNPHNHSPIVLVHGLFGSLDNLGILARDLIADHDIVQVDMRNHGLSPRSPEMTYPAMAQDLLDTLDAHQIERATFIGHSMGGKAVMALTALAPERISGLVAIDIAPVDYHVRRHDEIFAAIRAVSESAASTRQQAAQVMREHLQEEGVIQFLPEIIRRRRLALQRAGAVGPVSAYRRLGNHPGLAAPDAVYSRRQLALCDRRLPRRAAGPVPAGPGPRHRRRRTLGPCRETRGGVTRHPPLSDEHRRLIG